MNYVKCCELEEILHESYWNLLELSGFINLSLTHMIDFYLYLFNTSSEYSSNIQNDHELGEIQKKLSEMQNVNCSHPFFRNKSPIPL